jgi:hypothetical protein
MESSVDLCKSDSWETGISGAAVFTIPAFEVARAVHALDCEGTLFGFDAL